MARFPFVDMQSRARKDPLGPLTFNQLGRNIEAVQGLAALEHIASTGRHNALEVPRVLGRSVWGGASYTDYLYSDTNYYTSSSNPATGEVDFVLNSAGFTLPYVVPMAACCDEDVLNKPWLINVSLVSTSSVKVYLSKLSSALGAGNTWAAANGSFSLGLHSLPVAAFPSLSAIGNKQRRDFLTEGVGDWNSIVAAQGSARKLALVEHDSSGNHNAVQVARETGFVTYDAGVVKYNVSAGDIASVSRVSQGICTVTTTRTFSATSAMAVFLEVMPVSNLDLWIANYRITSTTTFVVYLYRYSAGVWNRADGDFFISVFGS